MKRTLAAVAAIASFAPGALAGCSKDNEPAQESAAAPTGAGSQFGDDAGAAGQAPTQPGSPHGAGSASGGISVSVAEGIADFGVFRAAIPEGWQYREPASQMRVAEFSLPAEADGEPAELVVFYFGEDGAGGVQANIERWVGQFEADEPADIEEREMAGLPVTTVDVTGRYVAPVTPGAADTYDEPGHRMFAAIVETSQGPFYFRALGDAATVGAHLEGALSMLGSIEQSGE